jgi:hypothetical protein
MIMLRVRALETLGRLMHFSLEAGAMAEAARGVCICLTKDAFPLVRIKAVRTLERISKYSNTKSVIEPFIPDILAYLAEILGEYDRNSLRLLKHLFIQFPEATAPFAPSFSQKLTAFLLESMKELSA